MSKEFNNRYYYFCKENLSDYEKMIYYWAIIYSYNPSFDFNETELDNIAKFLNVDFVLLSRALSNREEYKEILFGDHVVLINIEDIQINYFHLIIYVYLIYASLKNINYNNSDSIRNNFRVVDVDIHYLCTIYSRLSEISHIYYNSSFELFDNAFSNLNELIRLYRSLVSLYDEEDRCLFFDDGLFDLIILAIKHEFLINLNALYVVFICHLMKHTFLLKKELKDISNDMYRNFSFVFKNARVISISVNKQSVNVSKRPDDRIRQDNTTQMQFVYGFGNFDDYELRFDFAHQGELFAHFNNESPKRIKSFLFYRDQYYNIIDSYPDFDIESLFVSYGTQLALKEKENCDFKSQAELKRIYNDLIKKYSHYKLFEIDYKESDIIDFVKIISNMLPTEFCRTIDLNRELVNNCFIYDRIMRDIELLILSIMNTDTIIGIDKEKAQSISNKLVESIKNSAWNNCIINKSDYKSIDSIDDLVLIALTVQERAGMQ